jgi:integrase
MKRAYRGKVEKETVGNVTVKIYSRARKTITGGRRIIYEVADYSHGIRRLRSFSDSKKAHKEAERIARQIATGDAEGAQMRGKDASAYGHALELLRPYGVPLLTAVSRFVESFKILEGDRIIEASKDFARRNPTKRKPRTVREVSDELIALKTKRGGSGRYIEDLRNRLDTFSKAFAVDVAHVTTGDVQGWLDRMKGSPRTVKNFRDTANTLFKFAESHSYIARGENPVTATQKPETRNGEPITIYTPAELQRLIVASPDWFRPVIALQAFAGLRSAEVARLDWGDVKIERGHIELGASKTKTATRRLVPIAPNLALWLKPHVKQSGKVFKHSRAYFHEVQRNLSVATATKKEKALEWKHNALRHSFISYRVADTSDVPKVALESGNSPAMIFAHYRELVTPADAKLWFAIIPEDKA